MRIKYYLPIYNQIFCGICLVQFPQPKLCTHVSLLCPARLTHLDSATPAIFRHLQGSPSLFLDSNLPRKYFDTAPIYVTEVHTPHTRCHVLHPSDATSLLLSFKDYIQDSSVFVVMFQLMDSLSPHVFTVYRPTRCHIEEALNFHLYPFSFRACYCPFS